MNRAKTAEKFAPRDADIGIVFALAIEAGGLERRLAGLLSVEGAPVPIKFGGLNGRSIVLAVSGAGRAAARAADVLIAGHHPRCVISAGFAGGLDPRLKRGDFLLPDCVLDAQGHELAIDARSVAEALSGNDIVHVGRLLTLDRIVNTPAEKRSLRHTALAVDMESHRVVEICTLAAVRCLVLRVISDSVDDELPPDIERFMTQKTWLGQLGAVTGSIFRKPSRVKDLWGLMERAIMLSDRLANLLEEVIPAVFQLPPRESEPPRLP